MAGLLAALFISACSSKNPDSLIGMNVDENLAMMDANASSDFTDASDANASSPPQASKEQRSQSRDVGSRPNAHAPGNEMNALEPDALSAPEEDESGQDENQQEPPNGV